MTPVLVSFLLCAFKGSLQTLLDDLFATPGGTALRSVTKSAVSQARQKLKATAFEALNDRLTGLLSELLPEPRWRGLRLVATDSTAPCAYRRGRKTGMNSVSAIRQQRSTPCLGTRPGIVRNCPSKLMLKTIPGRFDDAERALWAQLLPQLASDDLLIAWIAAFRPCGYSPCCNSADCPFSPASTAINGRRWSDFCARIGLTPRLPLTHIGKRSPPSPRRGDDRDREDRDLAVDQGRLVCPGHLEVLATSLIDPQAYPAPAFAELYHGRWNIKISHR